MRIDVLANVLSVAKVGGVVTSHVRAAAPWGFRLRQTPFAAFHAVAQGTCWLRLPGTEPIQLVPGDVTLLPTGAGHVVASSPSGTVVSYEDVVEAAGGTDVDIDGPGPFTRLICGAYPFDTEVAEPLMSLLPPVVHVPAEHSESRPALQATLRMLGTELREPGHGSQAIVDRLVDVLFVHILRAWLDTGEASRGSWLAGLRDPLIADAIGRLHADPARARAHPLTRSRFPRGAGLDKSRASAARHTSTRGGGGCRWRGAWSPRPGWRGDPRRRSPGTTECPAELIERDRRPVIRPHSSHRFLHLRPMAVPAAETDSPRKLIERTAN